MFINGNQAFGLLFRIFCINSRKTQLIILFKLLKFLIVTWVALQLNEDKTLYIVNILNTGLLFY